MPVLIESDYDAMIMTGTLVSIDKSRHLSEDDGVKLLKCITVLKISQNSESLLVDRHLYGSYIDP